MARHKGRGMASINYPIGMNLGGDPSQALIHSNPDGKFTVMEVECLGYCDLAPVLQVNFDYYEEVTRESVDEIIGKLA